jgi:predicted ester cyclase
MGRVNICTVSVLVLVSLACAAPVDDSTSRLDWDAHVRTLNQALVNEGDFDRIPEFIAESYVMHTPAGPKTGRELIRDFISALREAFPDLEVETEVLAVDDDKVVWRRIHRGTHEGEFMGVSPTGRLVTWEAIVVTRYEDGMVVEEWGASTLGAVLLTL